MGSALKEVYDVILKSKGLFQAKRLERAADEVPGLDKMYSPKALQRALSEDDRFAFGVVPTRRFEEYAAPLTDEYLLSPNLRYEDPLDRSAVRSGPYTPTLTTDQYIDALSKVPERGGFDNVPQLGLGYRRADHLPTDDPLSIVGHEGRHTSRALNLAGYDDGLVMMRVKDPLKGPLPYEPEGALEKLRALIGDRPIVVPENQTTRPDRAPMRLPELFADGGPVHMAGGGYTPPAVFEDDRQGRQRRWFDPYVPDPDAVPLGSNSGPPAAPVLGALALAGASELPDNRTSPVGPPGPQFSAPAAVTNAFQGVPSPTFSQSMALNALGGPAAVAGGVWGAANAVQGASQGLYDAQLTNSLAGKGELGQLDSLTALGNGALGAVFGSPSAATVDNRDAMGYQEALDLSRLSGQPVGSFQSQRGFNPNAFGFAGSDIYDYYADVPETPAERRARAERTGRPDFLADIVKDLTPISPETLAIDKKDDILDAETVTAGTAPQRGQQELEDLGLGGGAGIGSDYAGSYGSQAANDQAAADAANANAAAGRGFDPGVDDDSKGTSEGKGGNGYGDGPGDDVDGYADGGRIGRHQEDDSGRMPREWFEQETPFDNSIRLLLEGSGGKNDGIVSGGGRATLNVPAFWGTTLSPYVEGGGAVGHYSTPEGKQRLRAASDPDYGIMLRKTVDFADGGMTHDFSGSGDYRDTNTYPTIQSVLSNYGDEIAQRNMDQYKVVGPQPNELTPWVGPHLADAAGRANELLGNTLNPFYHTPDESGDIGSVTDRVLWDVAGVAPGAGLLGSIENRAGKAAIPYLQSAAPELKRLAQRVGLGTAAVAPMVPDDAEASLAEQLAKLMARRGPGELAPPFYSKMHLAAMDAKPGEYGLDQWKKIFLGKAVKPQEIDWNFRNHPFGDKPVSQQEMQDFLDTNALKPTETRMSENAASPDDIEFSHGSWETAEPDDNYFRNNINDRLDELKQDWAAKYDIPLEEVDEDEVIQKALEQERDWYYQSGDSPQSRSVDVTLPDGSSRTFHLSESHGDANLWSPDYRGGEELWSGRGRDIFDDDKVEEVIRDHLAEQWLLDLDPSAERGVQYGRGSYGQYMTPGGEDYRELTLHLPESHVHGSDFTGAHHRDLPEDNILAHMRYQTFTDPDGKKVLHVDETQSDWHQQAYTKRMEEIRKRAKEAGITNDKDALARFGKEVPVDWGYKTPEIKKAVNDAAVLINALQAEKEQAVYRLNQSNNTEESSAASHVVADVEERLKEAKRSYNDLDRRYSSSLHPDAPYKTDWQELAAKRMVKWAADNDYDKITWTTGKQQADRYALDRQVNNIRYEDGRLRAQGTNGDEMAGQMVEPTVEALTPYIGDELAKRLVDSIGPNGYGELSGSNLKMLNRGKSAIYDSGLRQAMEKIGKPHGVQVIAADSPDAIKLETDGALQIPTWWPPDGFIDEFLQARGFKDFDDFRDTDRISRSEKEKINDAYKAHRDAAQKAFEEEYRKNNYAGTAMHGFELTPSLKDHARKYGFEAFAKGGSVKSHLEQLKADRGRRMSL